MKVSLRLLLSSFILVGMIQVGCDAAPIGSPEQEGALLKQVASYKKKEYVGDESKTIVRLNATDQYHRMELTCGRNERVMHFTFTTDKYGYETSFEWKTLGRTFASGPGPNENFADETTYSRRYCVKAGQQYRLKMKDRRGDGMCCEFGRGRYSVKIGGETIYDSKGKQTFTSVGSHAFRVKRAPGPQSKTSNPGGGAKNGCITVRVKADRNPDEASWRILNRNGGQVATSSALKALVPVSKTVCLPSGQYEFVVRDQYGDGLCCASGEGYFAVTSGGREIIRGGRFQSQKRYRIQINPRYEDEMSDRDREWLAAHNTRRRKYHREFGGSYVPLQWSPQLSAQAERWASKLLDGCETDGIEHERGVLEGENLAKNRGSGSYGELYPADNIVYRWVERERDWGYPRNSHLTQCLWRSTKYLGCGEASRTFNKGRGMCRIQVCRYARAGNCNMSKHNANIGNNWIKPMMEDHSKCGPECAPEGCY